MTTTPHRADILGYLVEFHLSSDAIAQDPERLSQPTRVGPFRFPEEADDFAEDHMRFYDRYEVVGLLEGVMSPQEWIDGEWIDEDSYELDLDPGYVDPVFKEMEREEGVFGREDERLKPLRQKGLIAPYQRSSDA